MAPSPDSRTNWFVVALALNCYSFQVHPISKLKAVQGAADRDGNPSSRVHLGLLGHPSDQSNEGGWKQIASFQVVNVISSLLDKLNVPVRLEDTSKLCNSLDVPTPANHIDSLTAQRQVFLNCRDVGTEADRIQLAGLRNEYYPDVDAFPVETERNVDGPFLC